MRLGRVATLVGTIRRCAGRPPMKDDSERR